MNLNLSRNDVFFRIKNQDKCEAYEIIKEYSDYSEGYYGTLSRDLMRLKIPAQRDRSKILHDINTGYITGLSISDYKFDKKIWKRIKERYYTPNRKSMEKEMYESIMGIFSRKVPCPYLLNKRLFGVDQFKKPYQVTDLVSFLFDIGDFTYARCDKYFFKENAKNFPKGIETLTAIDVVKVHEKAYVDSFFKQINISEEDAKSNPVLKMAAESNPVGIIKVSDSYVLDGIYETVQRFNVMFVGGEVSDINIEICGVSVSCNKIRISELLESLSDKYDGNVKNIKSIHYIGGDSDKHTSVKLHQSAEGALGGVKAACVGDIVLEGVGTIEDPECEKVDLPVCLDCGTELNSTEKKHDKAIYVCLKCNKYFCYNDGKLEYWVDKAN